MVYLLGVLLALSGCTYSRADLSYEKFEDRLLPFYGDAPGRAKVLGKIRTDEKGAAWDDCEILVQRSLTKLADEARALGGNAVGNIRWIPDDSSAYKTPRCKRRWGFALFFPLLMSHVFMSATVEADALAID